MTTESEHSTDSSGPEPVSLPQDSFTVEVVTNKTVLQSFRSKDKAGKPVMEIREPRVKLIKGKQLLVSSTRVESSKDKGDGIIHATGNILFYYIIDDPSNGSLAGLYVKLVDVERV